MILIVTEIKGCLLTLQKKSRSNEKSLLLSLPRS